MARNMSYINIMIKYGSIHTTRKIDSSLNSVLCCRQKVTNPLSSLCRVVNKKVCHQQSEFIGSAQRVGFFNIGSGRVVDKIPGSGSDLGRVGVTKNTIRYFRVSFFFRVFPGISGISGYVGYFWVFLGLPIYTRVIF